MCHDYHSPADNKLPAEKDSVSGVVSLVHPLRNEGGAVLVISIMILAVLTFLGIAALNTTDTEIRISTNDKVYKQAFYSADTGISYSVENGITMFPPAAINTLVSLSPVPADLPPNITLEYTDKGGSPRRVEIRSTGVSSRGANVVIVAGIYGVLSGAQEESGYGATY